ncbi:MAG: translation initiation factor eIF-1A [Thermoplasmata archaeon]|nr:translation initiation factor eIF-1A [Thermoplasmata archaeon]
MFIYPASDAQAEETPLANYNSRKRKKADAAPEQIVRVRLPRKRESEIFAIADQNLGAYKIRIICADGKSRLGRIPGKIKKRMWIREGDLLIVRPWSFQDEKADIIYRYTKTQSAYLSRKRMLPEILDNF